MDQGFVCVYYSFHNHFLAFQRWILDLNSRIDGALFFQLLDRRQQGSRTGISSNTSRFIPDDPDTDEADLEYSFVPPDPQYLKAIRCDGDALLLTPPEEPEGGTGTDADTLAQRDAAITVLEERVALEPFLHVPELDACMCRDPTYSDCGSEGEEGDTDGTALPAASPFDKEVVLGRLSSSPAHRCLGCPLSLALQCRSVYPCVQHHARTLIELLSAYKEGTGADGLNDGSLEPLFRSTAIVELASLGYGRAAARIAKGKTKGKGKGAAVSTSVPPPPPGLSLVSGDTCEVLDFHSCAVAVSDASSHTGDEDSPVVYTPVQIASPSYVSYGAHTLRVDRIYMSQHGAFVMGPDVSPPHMCLVASVCEVVALSAEAQASLSPPPTLPSRPFALVAPESPAPPPLPASQMKRDIPLSPLACLAVPSLFLVDSDLKLSQPQDTLVASVRKGITKCIRELCPQTDGVYHMPRGEALSAVRDRLRVLGQGVISARGKGLCAFCNQPVPEAEVVPHASRINARTKQCASALIFHRDCAYLSPEAWCCPNSTGTDPGGMGEDLGEDPEDVPHLSTSALTLYSKGVADKESAAQAQAEVEAFLVGVSAVTAWYNVNRAAKRSRKLSCKVCGVGGASVGCWVPSCRHVVHAGCAVQQGWHFGEHRAYYCPVHDKSKKKR
ncbi:hypothetical protein KIPB_005896 [Kipferlia bialata]|uniref:Uncharacterized protein n=1 Tax=Kipferlia bialata TaxID=797122 RepID=A0A9K3CY21_9EUKA|nr:hypothetical protein KIPB_005896 [Kipferlia bialata]|eukprot:g5896.t1